MGGNQYSTDQILKPECFKVSIITSQCLSTQKNKSQICVHIPVLYHRCERGHGDKVPGIQYTCITPGVINVHCAPTVITTKVKIPSRTRVAMAVQVQVKQSPSRS